MEERDVKENLNVIEWNNKLQETVHDKCIICYPAHCIIGVTERRRGNW